MNDQILQDWDTIKILCSIHSDCSLQLVYFGESPKLKSRLLCTKCMIEIFNSEERQPALLYLKDFLSNPSNQLMKITRINCSLNKVNESEMIEVIEKIVQQYKDTVKQQIQMIRKNLSQMKEQLATIDTELINNWKLNDVLQQFKLLAQMDDSQRTNELIQLEEQLNNISVNLIQNYIRAQEKVKDNQTLIVSNFQNNFKIIQNEFEYVSLQSLELLQNIVCHGMPGILYDDLHQFPQIHQEISQGKQIQYKLLYQGTIDGLNGQSLWEKCDGQTNLLTIMTSNNGNRFGAYSPSYSNSALQVFVEDSTMKSFLFQYNKKEIYKIKDQEYAIYCNSQYGPRYGKNDLYIEANFQGGYSIIGDSYDISKYNIVDVRNHLYGATAPLLKECKVYKVIF